jgi:putative flippase GtrA
MNYGMGISRVETGGLRLKSVYQEAGKFLGSGFLGTVCHYGILWILVNKGLMDPVVASSFGMVAGAVVVYLLNFHITFNSPKKHFGAVSRFVPMVGIGFTLNGSILYIAIHFLALPLILSQVLATAAQFFFGFYVSRKWVF